MQIVSVKLLFEKLMSGERTQITVLPRKGEPLRVGASIIIQWKHPMGFPIGVAKIIELTRIKLEDITEDIAHREGFKDARSMKRALLYRYKQKPFNDKLNEVTFEVIRFEWRSLEERVLKWRNGIH